MADLAELEDLTKVLELKNGGENGGELPGLKNYGEENIGELPGLKNYGEENGGELPKQVLYDSAFVGDERVKELAAREDAHTHPLTTPVEQCFDWAKEIPHLVMSTSDDSCPAAAECFHLEFYLVVFRSIRKSSADTFTLYSADAAAHEEARLSGGLLKYWYGVLNERRECLAMCIWASREDAVKAIHRPAHREAMKLASVMYDKYTLERYSLRIDENLRPSFKLLGRMSS